MPPLTLPNGVSGGINCLQLIPHATKPYRRGIDGGDSGIIYYRNGPGDLLLFLLAEQGNFIAKREMYTIKKPRQVTGLTY
jgi:hypothetical protein